MRATLVALAALSICTACASNRPPPINLVDFTTLHPIGVAFDRLDHLSRRCFAAAGLQVESAVYRDTGSGAIDLTEADGTVLLAINLKALSPGQTAVKMTFPPDVSVERTWLQSIQAYTERGGSDCPVSAPRRNPPAVPR